MSSDENLAIPRGSIVVVTGANGLIGSHVVDQLLATGYLVRGTVRDVNKSAWLNDYFGTKYGPKKFSLVEVPDQTKPNAFSEAFNGASGLEHIATIDYPTTDVEQVISNVVNSTVSALEAATNEPSLKRVVVTSSSLAAILPEPNVPKSVNNDTWNEEVVQRAYAARESEDTLYRRMVSYSASKTRGEQAAWEFMRQRNPHFVLNTVLPNANFGPTLAPEHQGYPSTIAWLRVLWAGIKEQVEGLVLTLPPQWFVNVQDDALIHVSSLIYDDVKSERIFAFAEPFNWNDILREFRKLAPGKEFSADVPDLGRDLSDVANQRAEELLKRLKGSGWTSLEESVKETTEGWE